MKNLLAAEYGIDVRNQVHLLGKEGFQDAECLYFIIPSNNREVIHMEQAALAYYLAENNYHHVAYPIPTANGRWFVHDENEHTYMVVKVDQLQEINPRESHGKKVALFHQIGTAYRYEPQEISSYGQWKALWINKITQFEQRLLKEAKANSNQYYRLVMDMLPYLIGISENAIQYIQESEADPRFHEIDQGTIVFQRYRKNLLESVIWGNQLAYDHPSRDIAEFIRHAFLTSNFDGWDIVKPFMSDYQEIRPLSVFSWRLIYARLLYPIHLFDCLQRGFVYQDYDRSYEELKELLNKQVYYENYLGQFFHRLQVDYKNLDIPVVHWL